jgi:hypothetical protein
MTVGDLVLRLACDRTASLRLAMNPSFPWPTALHRSWKHVRRPDGRPVVYLAEGRDAVSRLGHLPPEVAVALT